MGNDQQQSIAPTSKEVTREWRCFHCDEVFTDRETAAVHFGVQIDGYADDVACKLNAVEGQLVKMLREAHEELRQYHQEDNAAFRQFHSLGAEHATALRREEEKGYARGLEDAKKHPETIGLRRADETPARHPQGGKGHSQTINGYQIKRLLEFVDGDEECEVEVEWLPERTADDGEKMEAGLYCWLTDYPDEGVLLLDESMPDGAAMAGPPVDINAVLAALEQSPMETKARCTCFEDEHGPDCEEHGCCGQCKGSQSKAKADHSCRRCHGSGTIEVPDEEGPNAHPMDVNCPVCKGTGVESAENG